MRKRPQRHIRRINGKAVVVNAGVPKRDRSDVVVRHPGSHRSDLKRVREGESKGSPAVTTKRRFGFGRGRKIRRGKNGDLYYVRDFDPVTKTGKLKISFRGSGLSKVENEYTLGPNMFWNDTTAGPLFEVGGNFTNLNLQGSYIGSTLIKDFDFSESVLDGSVFSGRDNSPRERLLLDSVSFRGASLRNVTFEDAEFRGVDFSGTDLTGVSFIGVRVSAFARIKGRGTGKDFLSNSTMTNVTGSNITREQVHQLEKNIRAAPHVPLIYESYSFDEVRLAANMTEEDFVVLIWAGEIECRDNATRKVIEGSFDSKEHHIPQWEMDRLVPGSGR